MLTYNQIKQIAGAELDALRVYRVPKFAGAFGVSGLKNGRHYKIIAATNEPVFNRILKNTEMDVILADSPERLAGAIQCVVAMFPARSQKVN